uniref:ATP synthase F0 subunit 8 n=1 Tax=Pandalus japonicus TaxID=666362 RepID=A0A516F068_PANJP|nr:ATP synthase F0 subunit 8 [Pandalus japonicus]
MPQMAPLMWLNLYGFFTLMFLLFIIINYYIKPIKKIGASLQGSAPFKFTLKW